MWRLSILVILLPLAVFAERRPLAFATDYCTNFPEGTRQSPSLWKHCCLTHDMYFWAGGNKTDRNNADQELKVCIEETGERRIAELMYRAVRAGSYSPIKYPKMKWNNGWEKREEFQTLSISDIDQIEEELSHGYEYISSELKQYFIQSLRSRLE